jgi:hypothetical protein
LAIERILPIWRQMIEDYGMQLRIEELIAEGNLVAARFTETGTFRAPAFGQQAAHRQEL